MYDGLLARNAGSRSLRWGGTRFGFVYVPFSVFRVWEHNPGVLHRIGSDNTFSSDLFSLPQYSTIFVRYIYIELLHYNKLQNK
jgi:hypothetical protein